MLLIFGIEYYFNKYTQDYQKELSFNKIISIDLKKKL